MEGDSYRSVASAGTSHQTRTAMEGLEKAQVPHNRLEKGSRIPVKSKLPQYSHQKKLTSQTQAQTTRNAVIRPPERSQGRGKSAEACGQEKEKPPSRLISRVKPTAGRREGDDTRGKAAGSVRVESAKENVAPSSSTSVNGGGQHGHSQTAKKPTVKSSMSYMELKRRHQELLSEITTLEGKSREQEESHWAQVNHFAKEIEESKETNLALREEINSYQAIVNERNTQLDALQQRLDEIKFENERLAAILEGSKLDAVTGEKIAKSVEFQGLQGQLQLQFGSQEQALDDFIGALECTLSQLQAVLWALKHGYRQIDTAAFYKNEEEVGSGSALKKCGIPREEIYVITKNGMNEKLITVWDPLTHP